MDAVVALDIGDLVEYLAEAAHLPQRGQAARAQPARRVRDAGRVYDVVRRVDALLAGAAGQQPEPARGPLLRVLRMLVGKEVGAPDRDNSRLPQDSIAEQPRQRL